MLDNHRKILTAVVTRNRVPQLARALDLISRQTRRPEQVLVVDNASEPATQALVEQWQGRISGLVYRNTGCNSGSAGGQKRAMEYAVANGFDLIYTMDDDCEPQVNALETIVQAWLALADREGWVLNSVVKDLTSERLSFGLWAAEAGLPRKPAVVYHTLDDIPAALKGGNLFAHWGCFFNGTLLPVKLIAQVGLPREEFFIRGDEVEYFCRISRRFRVGTALTSLVRHPREVPGPTALPFWKTYFQTRNNTVIDKIYFPSFRTQPFYLSLKALKHRLLAAFGVGNRIEHAVCALAIQDAISDKFDRNAFELGK